MVPTKETVIDSLTNLYKKEYVRMQIESFLQNKQANDASENDAKQSQHVMLVVDVDNLSGVNSRLGNKAGNALLKNIACGLRETFCETDVVGRIGGDQFLLFMKHVSSMTAVIDKINDIQDIFAQTSLGGSLDKLTCSIGIARYPSDGMDFLGLLYCADYALRYVKQQGANAALFYDSDTMQVFGEIRTPEEVYQNYILLPEEEEPISKLESELVGFSLDVLNEAKDTDRAICLILNQMGRIFDVSNVSILECNREQTRLGLTYFWDYQDACRKTELYRGIGYNNYEGYKNCFDLEGIYAVSNINELSNEIKANGSAFAKQSRILSFIQCAMYEEGVFRGCISLHDTRKAHEWTRRERLELSTATKIISTHLLRMRANEEVQAQMYRLENYDSLTGLPTQSCFKKNVKNYIKYHPDRKYAVVASDICNFKYVNDTLGYEVGDHILQEYSKLLRGMYESPELVCRVSSDNFLGLMEFESEEKLREALLDGINRFNQKQKALNLNRNLAVISGISLISEQTQKVTEAIDNANIARKTLNGMMKSACRFYSSEMEQQMHREMEIVTSMERALQNHEFVVYLQPKYELLHDHMVGAEALVRWIKPDQSRLNPVEFIPVFEKNGFVVNVDFFVYEEVCKNLRKWLDEGKPVVPISINVSRLHLNDELFFANLLELVERYRIPKHLIELELTESVFLNHTEDAMGIMKKLREAGFGVAIDDFGAGYSSLNLLKDMETDVIKLDKEFFRPGQLKKEDKIILSNIITMAKQLNMKVLSEGVETAEQSEFLKEVDCDMVQGYLYAKPMPISSFEDMIA